MATRRLTDQDLERMSRMREAGKTYGQIGLAIGCSAKAVSWHCLRLGVEGPRPTKLWNGIVGPAVFIRNGREVRRYTAEDDAVMLELERQGLAVHAIAKRMGRRPVSVRGRLMTLARREERNAA